MVNSTVGDLLLWDQALYTDKLINDTDRQAIFSGATLASGARTDYGFGWALLDSKPYGRIVNHTGGWAGYISLIERHLDTGMTIIMLQNNATDRIQIPLKVVRKILYHEPLVTEGLKPVSTSASLEKYVGLYSASTIPLKLAVFIRDNSLWAQGQAAGQRPFRLDAYKHHTFKYEAASIRMVFDPEKRTLSFEQGDKVSHIFAKEQ
ncbi:serine hydrolase [Spirosoma sp. KUDC1026]|uniref:serine hydrolase n=1 Tax=Spirosoma sp. KUDC1026 TaxID=2745947 RepID=UPI001C3F7726|nr:serine hydrolase [Spirosoma sp. KUDC1026]